MRVTALVLLFALTACIRCVAGTTGVINGYVRDDTGQRAADVLVTVVSRSQADETYTDKRGFFVFLALPPDVYSVRAEKDGTSNAYAMGVRVNSDQTAFLTFRFMPYMRCPAFTRVTLGASQESEHYWSLDVQRMAQYPPNVAPPILLPMANTARPYMCL